MEKISYNLFVLAICFITFACKDKSSVNNESINDLNEKEKITVNIGNQINELVFSFESLETANNERVWKDFKIEPKLKIGSIEDETFYFPGRIKIDGNYNIYVLDFKDYSVKKFDKAGNFIRKFGKQGQGPGELTNPFDFDVIDDGKVALLGVNDNRIVIFDNEKINDFKIKLMPMRLCFVSSNEVVTYQIFDPIYQSPFQKINLKADIKTDYQNILSKESFGGKDFGMLPFLLGDIHRFSYGKLVFVSSILGYVVVYNENGKIEKVFKLIDKIVESVTSKRELKDGELQMIAFPRQKEYLVNSSNVFGNNLFILSNQAKHKKDEYVIDVYSLLDGKYKYSLLFEGMDKIIEIFLTNDKIYIAKENTEVEVFDYSIID